MQEIEWFDTVLDFPILEQHYNINTFNYSEILFIAFLFTFDKEE